MSRLTIFSNLPTTQKPKKSIQRFRGLAVGSGTLFILDTIVVSALGKWHLGTVLPLFFGGFLLAHGLCWHRLQRYFVHHPQHKKLWQLLWLFITIWLVTVGVFFYYIAKNAQVNTNNQPVKAMLVLGSGYKNGQPTPTLASRLDAAAQLERSQPTALMILSGGIGLTETVSEASVMADYLEKKYHIPRSQMALEEKSTSTELNIKNSQPILANHGIGLNEPIAIVTSDFHTLRAKAIAKKQGYQNIITVGSSTPLLTRYNNWLREYFAFVSGFVLNEF